MKINIVSWIEIVKELVKIFKAYCRFASPICDYLLFNRKRYKVNHYPGMKDMVRDIDVMSVIIVI